MVILRLALAQVIVVVIGSNIIVDLVLLALARHLAGAESSIEGQFLVLAIEFPCIQEIERVIHIDVVALRDLIVVQRIVGIVHILGIDVAMTLTIAATQLVTEQEAIVFVEIIFAAQLEAAHVVGIEAILVNVVVRACGAVEVQILDVGVGVVAALTHTAVGIEKKVILFGGVVEADVAHCRGNPAGQRIGHRERQRSTHIDVHHTVESQGASGLVLEFDIDDTTHALGVVFRRGVGDNLDILHRRSRNLFQQRCQVTGEQLAGTSVDEHLDIGGSSQRHVAVVVHRHAGHLLQHIGGGAAT